MKPLKVKLKHHKGPYGDYPDATWVDTVYDSNHSITRAVVVLQPSGLVDIFEIDEIEVISLEDK